MEAIKTIKVLIIEDEKGKNLSLPISIDQMLDSLGLKSIFSYVDEYEYLSKGLELWGFKIVCACSSFSKSSSFLTEILDYTLEHGNKILATLFISSDEKEMEKVKEFGFKLNFLKEENEKSVIRLEDLEKVKQTLLDSGKINYQVPHKNLVKPICVFSQTYADSTPSERLAQEACDEVGIRLNKKQIKYSACDPAGFCMKIYVEETDVFKIRIISENDDFWKEWVKKYLN